MNPTEDLVGRFGSGQSVKRIEDEGLLRGAGRYADDGVMPGQLAMFFLRSPYAHARITSMDASAARAMAGVKLVLTGADLAAQGVKPVPGTAGFKRPDGKDAVTPPRRVLAHEVVRYVGEAVAAVVAANMQQAKDAAEAIVVDYDPLPHVSTIEDATAPGAPALSPDAPDNMSAEARWGDAAACDAAFSKAKHVVALDIRNQRVAAVSIEPRTVQGYIADDGRLTLRMSTQMPSGVRNTLQEVLGLKREQLRVLVGDVGGGFGLKTGMYPEDAAVAWASWQLKQPVKWAAERGEDFLSATHGRDLQSDAQLAFDGDGRVLGLRLHSRANLGAYATGAGVAIQLLVGPWVQTSVYHIPVIDFKLQAFLTNRAPTGPYRGAGRPEAIYTMERLMDEAARQLGIDRVELRRRNFIQPSQMPYRNPMQQTYDVGEFEKIMNAGLALADWKGFEARAAESQRNGKLRGLGLATFLEWTSGNVFEERVTVEVKSDGMIEVFSAVNQMGQGIATTLAQLVIDVFGVPLEKVRVVLGDTDRGDGFGSAGSRSIFIGGSALKVGAQKTLDEARKLAARSLEAAESDIDYRGGRFVVKGTDVAIGLFELAAEQQGGRIFVESTSSVQGPSWPNGCHVSEVEIDPQTGSTHVVKYSSVNDVGRVVNPMIVRGQLDGGAVQGIGQALCEEIVYDSGSGQLLTGTIMDYAVPRADIVRCDFVTEMDQSVPCTTNPLGVKGVGELGTIGATPCVVNAIADAFARAGMAAQAARLEMPLTPAKVWGMLNGA
ncbi:MAG TPA: xanthine dehydrogenase family protein molybdopterin-binding subunit [Ramlibacter sp.]|nr:xanthine dehydrogenase family protein molybdopterin-binding subunit [Ramlibacter sp.]